jgi:hypothetical protein
VDIAAKTVEADRARVEAPPMPRVQQVSTNEIHADAG